MNLFEVESKHSEDLSAVDSWCDEIYQKNFSKYFSDQRSLFDRLRSKSHPITDQELEWILTQVPVNLFDASEKLSKLQTYQEVLKLNVKKKETKCRRTEDNEDEIFEDKVLLLAYSSILTRVEKEMSYSRELIMSAKKIWDSRRRTDASNPVSEMSSVDNLPDYSVSIKNKSYIG